MQYIQPSMVLALSAWRDANFGKIISDLPKTVSSPVFQFGTTRVEAHPLPDNQTHKQANVLLTHPTNKSPTISTQDAPVSSLVVKAN